MATYAFHCLKCDADFEVVMKPSEVGEKTVRCPACKGKKVTRVYTAFFAKTSRKS